MTIAAERTETGAPKFKTCHGMNTKATLYREVSPPRVVGQTHIWSHCWIGGFTGTVVVAIGDASGNIVTWAAPTESWGVNGEWEAALGGSSNDIVVNWQATVDDPSMLPLAYTLSIDHSWAPQNRLMEILEEAVRTGAKIAAVTASIAALVP